MFDPLTYILSIDVKCLFTNSSSQFYKKLNMNIQGDIKSYPWDIIKKKE